MATRPDFSNLLAHFVTGRKPCVDNASNPAISFANMSPIERLVSILNGKKIVSTTMPWINRPAVCFTECPWTSLLAHAERYSPYGIGFQKSHVFAAGGGPVYYVRADHWEKQNWDSDIKTFVTPFWPSYRPAKMKSAVKLNGKSVDFSHEREWRVPHDFTFKLEQIEFVVLNTHADMEGIPKKLMDAIGSDKFLIMENYRSIERLWPVHRA